MTKLVKLPVPKYNDAFAITVVVKENPKRGKCAGAFALYRTGMTVGQFKTAYAAWKSKPGSVKCPAGNHLKWDTERGFIALKG